MSGPTRQRSFRERLHGIGIPWQGKKTKICLNEKEQSLSETESKSGVQDQKGCDQVPPADEEPGGQKDDTKRGDRPSSVTEEPKATEEKSVAHKHTVHIEKKLLNRSFTQPKGTEEYKVTSSDTLERIAATFDTTPSELAKLNRLTARMIFPGQMLFVPEKRNSMGAAVTSSSAEVSDDDAKSNEMYKDPLSWESHQKGDDNNRLGLSGDDGQNAQRRKVSVTDALRIPYRRHSDRMQRFMKVKARHFTDGQGVVSGVLIITPNAVMFDPNVSDPLVIEHGIESYGVIAPLDMVMRTAIYFDIAHMKVKNAPESQFNIPKPDIYYGKMNNITTATDTEPSKPEDKATDADHSEKPEEAPQPLNSTPPQTPKPNDEEAKEEPSTSPPSSAQETTVGSREQVVEEGNVSKIEDSKDQNESMPSGKSEDESGQETADSEHLSRDGSLDKEVSEAFSNDSKKTLSGRNSVGSPTPSPSQPTEDGNKQESRRERMLKRLSYPMESITSYTQSSISRILSSSPKSFVDFSSGLFVRSSEEDKAKEGATVPPPVVEEDEKPEAKENKEQLSSDEPPPDDVVTEPDANKVTKEDTVIKEDEKVTKEDTKVTKEDTKVTKEDAKVTKEDTNVTSLQKSADGSSVSVGYKNLVEEKPELFAALDKLLKLNAAQEQEGPPLYLCLRLGHPKEKKKTTSTPILSYGKKKAKSEYWFSIPHNRVEDLYSFLQQWFPQLYGDVDDVDPDELGFVPINEDEEDQEEENAEEEQKEEENQEQTEGEEKKSSTPRSFLKLVEDHFGFRSISPTDWEVLSMSESEKISFEDCELPPPDLLSPSEILEEDHVKELYTLLPARVVGYPWALLFSTSEHGFNLKTMYRKMSDYDAPVLLAIQDTERSIFGALISSPLRQSDHFYGNGECFLYTFYPEFKVFRWTGVNTYFAKGDTNCVAMGAGDGQFGIWIDSDLNHGRCQKCLTYDNDILCKSEDFIIKSLEVWGFV